MPHWIRFLVLAVAILPVATEAHVRVFSEAGVTSTPACGFTTFVVRVPVEKPIATNRIDLFVPKGVVAVAVQPKPNWHYDLRETGGLITSISWSGGRLMPREFDEFAFLAATPKVAGSVAWDAWQYYEDGTIVKWTGAPNTDTPHSITAITAAPCKTQKRTK